MPEILDQLRGKYGRDHRREEKQEIAEAFGTDEAVDLIDLLYNKCGDLQGNILTMYDALGSGTGRRHGDGERNQRNGARTV